MADNTQNPALHPRDEKDVLDAVQWAISERTPIEVRGHGSKQTIGRPMQVAHCLDLSGLTGVTLYEPEELVLTAKAGTALDEIEALLAKNNQELQFEPMVPRPQWPRPSKGR